MRYLIVLALLLAGCSGTPSDIPDSPLHGISAEAGPERDPVVPQGESPDPEINETVPEIREAGLELSASVTRGQDPLHVVFTVDALYAAPWTLAINGEPVAAGRSVPGEYADDFSEGLYEATLLFAGDEQLERSLLITVDAAPFTTASSSFEGTLGGLGPDRVTHEIEVPHEAGALSFQMTYETIPVATVQQPNLPSSPIDPGAALMMPKVTAQVDVVLRDPRGNEHEFATQGGEYGRLEGPAAGTWQIIVAAPTKHLVAYQVTAIVWDDDVQSWGITDDIVAAGYSGTVRDPLLVYLDLPDWILAELDWAKAFAIGLLPDDMIAHTVALPADTSFLYAEVSWAGAPGQCDRSGDAHGLDFEWGSDGDGTRAIESSGCEGLSLAGHFDGDWEARVIAERASVADYAITLYYD